MDTHELKVLNILEKHLPTTHIRDMFNQPVEQLKNLRRDYKSFIVSQSPIMGMSGKQKWRDFSVYDPANDVDCCIEVMTLKTKGDLSARSLKTLYHIPNMVEKQMIFVLLYNGFDDDTIAMLNFYKQLIHLDIIIYRSLDELDNHFKNIYYC